MHKKVELLTNIHLKKSLMFQGNMLICCLSELDEKINITRVHMLNMKLHPGAKHKDRKQGGNQFKR